MKEEEQWMPVPGMPVEASNMGRIRRTEAAGGPHGVSWPKGHVHKDWAVPGGYRQCRVNRKAVMVHRLVALAWIGPQPTPEHQINHKNKVRDDNRPGNLEWVTCSENHKHKFADGTTVPFNGKRGKRGPNVPREIVEKVASLRGTLPQAAIGAMYGLSQSHVSQIQKRLERAHHGA